MPDAPDRMLPLTVLMPEHLGDLGPKMRECSEQERRFVYALVITGGRPQDAARAAGYGGKSELREQRESAIRASASQLMRRERVLEAINEEAKKRLRAGALLAASVLTELLDPASGLSAKDRKSAAVEMLDRAGLVVQQKVEITTKNETEAQVVREIEALAKGLGLDPSRLLGHATTSEPVDAEFEVVQTSPFKPPPELEDIL